MLQSYDEIFDKIRNLKGDRVLKKHSPAKKNAFGVFRAQSLRIIEPLWMIL